MVKYVALPFSDEFLSLFQFPQRSKIRVWLSLGRTIRLELHSRPSMREFDLLMVIGTLNGDLLRDQNIVLYHHNLTTTD
jgi:hypothetical protein